ncbi:beta-ketoacyl reductase [Nocardia asteroides]
MGALPAREGLALFDTAVTAGAGSVVPIRVDNLALRSGSADLPPLLRTLVPVRRDRPGRAESARGLRDRVAGLAPARQAELVTASVCEQAASVLGHDTPTGVDPDQEFGAMGFDSLIAIKFRNRMETATGLTLSATLIFDYPTPRALAGHLINAITDSGRAVSDESVDDWEIRKLLLDIPVAALREAGLLNTLLRLRDTDATGIDGDHSDAAIDDMPADALIRLALDTASDDR